MMTIFLEDSFDAAHFLPNVPDGHKCRRMHGHTYRVRLEVTGELDPQMGWVLDYAELKFCWDHIKSLVDHQTLNHVPDLENPTCEHIALWIQSKLPRVSRIEVRETEHCGVVWQCS